jgi:hypothetical protein
MTDANHKFQISAAELACLKGTATNNQWLSGLLRDRVARHREQFTLRLNQREVERVRALLTERLASVGFQEDYSLTKEGQILEDLLDRFFAP